MVSALCFGVGASATEKVNFIIKLDDRSSRTIQIPWATLLMNNGEQVNEPCADDGTHTDDVFAGDNLWICNLTVENTGKGQLTLLDGGPTSTRIIERRAISLRSAGALRMTVRVSDGVAERKLKSRPSAVQSAFEESFEAGDGSLKGADEQSAGGDVPAPRDALPEDAMVENATLFEETVTVDAVEWRRGLLMSLGGFIVMLLCIRAVIRFIAVRIEREIIEVTAVVSRLNKRLPPPV